MKQSDPVLDQIESILQYYNANRGVGHTNLALGVLERNRSAIIVASNHSTIDRIKDRNVNTSDDQYAATGDFTSGKMMGVRRPIIFDNEAIFFLLANARREIIVARERHDAFVKRMQRLINDDQTD